jgi:hypothetical protein
MSAKKGNQYAKGNKGGPGREPIYKTPGEMQKWIDDYFNKEKIPTIPGLAYHLGFADKKSLIDYEGKQDFLFPVKRAKLKIEAFNAKELHREKGNITGVIFTLKNLGWKDAQDIDLNVDFDLMNEGQLDAIAFKLLNIKKKDNEKND